MKRVAVVGCPGAGKSTFCRQLSKLAGLPIIHLDTYYNDPASPCYLAKDLKVWEAKVAELISREQWIMDGNFGSTFKLRFGRADTIIFFDYPRYPCLWRIFKRRIEFHNKQRPEMHDEWRERFN